MIGLCTQTKDQACLGTSSTATGDGGVYLRALIKHMATGALHVGYPVAACAPNVLGRYQDATGYKGMTLDTRVQTLTQEIGARLVNVSGTSGSCTFDSTIDLILMTMGVGAYTVEIQTAVNSSASITGPGTAGAAAAFDLGSLS